jgi:hypothetical protein
MKHVLEKAEMHTGFYWGNLKEKRPLERPMSRW